MYETINILNSIKSATARSMSHSMYVNAKFSAGLMETYAGASLQSKNKSYSAPVGILCGGPGTEDSAVCWGDYLEAEESGQICLKEEELNDLQ